MALLVTDAIVLHAFDYLETSRIVRLITREAGVQSVLARGARGSKRRFGSGLDLFAQGEAQLQIKPGRELHTLVSFDVTRSRPEFATDLARFSAAAAFGECILRVVHDEAAPVMYDRIVHGFEQIARSDSLSCVSAALGALWRVISDAGFAPTLDECANCHRTLSQSDDATFSHVVGGTICADCSAGSPGRRKLPAEARAAIRRWLEEEQYQLATVADGRAHQRLLREFIAHHLNVHSQALTAYASWESGQYT